MMTSQLSQPRPSISSREVGRYGAVPKRAAQCLRYAVMSGAACMGPALDQSRGEGATSAAAAVEARCSRVAHRRRRRDSRALDGKLVAWYHGPMKEITRTQTGVRLESRLLKVLKALATELDLSLGDLLEGIVLHAFEGKAPFSQATLKKIRTLRAVYGLDLTARDSHQLREGARE